MDKIPQSPWLIRTSMQQMDIKLITLTTCSMECSCICNSDWNVNDETEVFAVNSWMVKVKMWYSRRRTDTTFHHCYSLLRPSLPMTTTFWPTLLLPLESAVLIYTDNLQQQSATMPTMPPNSTLCQQTTTVNIGNAEPDVATDLCVQPIVPPTQSKTSSHRASCSQLFTHKPRKRSFT